MGFFTLDKAVFFDEGVEVGKKGIPSIFLRKTFNYGSKSYVVDLKNGVSFRRFGLLINTDYYFYNLDNPFPLAIKKQLEPPSIDTDFLNVQLENKVARDLNRMGGNKLAELLSPKNIVIGVIVLALLYVVFTGQWKTLLGI